MDYRRRAVWGNVNDSSLLEIWRGEKRRRFLERMDGRELPDDDLCVRCEDALPAEPAAVAADERSAQPSRGHSGYPVGAPAPLADGRSAPGHRGAASLAAKEA
jgi:hypothetical protein